MVRIMTDSYGLRNVVHNLLKSSYVRRFSQSRDYYTLIHSPIREPYVCGPVKNLIYQYAIVHNSLFFGCDCNNLSYVYIFTEHQPVGLVFGIPLAKCIANDNDLQKKRSANNENNDVIIHRREPR